MSTTEEEGYEGVTDADADDDESRQYEPVMEAELTELRATVKVLTRKMAEREAEEERAAYAALPPMAQALEDLAEAGFNDSQQAAIVRVIDLVGDDAKEHAEKSAVVSGLASVIGGTLLGGLLHRRPKSLRRRVINYALEGAWGLLHD